MLRHKLGWLLRLRLVHSPSMHGSAWHHQKRLSGFWAQATQVHAAPLMVIVVGANRFVRFFGGEAWSRGLVPHHCTKRYTTEQLSLHKTSPENARNGPHCSCVTNTCNSPASGVHNNGAFSVVVSCCETKFNHKAIRGGECQSLEVNVSSFEDNMSNFRAVALVWTLVAGSGKLKLIE